MNKSFPSSFWFILNSQQAHMGACSLNVPKLFVTEQIRVMFTGVESAWVFLINAIITY